MRPTFMGFETASRGMMINQKAIDIIGNNVGNIGTTGYTRQRVDQVSMAVNYKNTRYSTMTALAGQGAGISGVSQIRDPFLDKRFREEYADVGYYDKMSSILSDVENALTEIEPSTLSKALQSFETSWTELGKNGTSDKVSVSSILSTAKTLTQVFKQIDTKLQNVWDQQKYDLNTNINSVNTILQGIAELNVSIRKEKNSVSYVESETYGPNELMDQRNVLIDQLSEFGDIGVKSHADGTVTVNMSGKTVVDYDQYETVNLVSGKSSKTVDLIWQSTGKSLQLGSGALKSSIEMLNGRGSVADMGRGEDAEKGILYYKDKIDKFSTTIADAFNHMVVEYDPATGEATSPVKYKTLFTFGDGSDDTVESTAANMMVNPEWEKNAEYLITDVQKKGDGIDYDAFVSLATEMFDRDLDFGEFKGTMTDYIAYYTTTTLGEQKKYSDTRLESCNDITENLLDRINSVSGVSFNEEATDMAQYKKAYDAMSRIMTTMDDMLEKLINGTGRVGL